MIESFTERDKVTGVLEVVFGPMFCGKTEELVRLLGRHVIAKRHVQAFNASIDKRYGPANELRSHGGAHFPATAIDIDKPRKILKLVKPETQVVVIDEGQFFIPEIVNVCEELVATGRRVIVGGLPTDFRGEPFGSMSVLMVKAENLHQLRAVCMVCGEDADFTQRLVDGKPASYKEPIVKVGAAELYEARCRKHHQVPGKPKFLKKRGG